VFRSAPATRSALHTEARYPLKRQLPAQVERAVHLFDSASSKKIDTGKGKEPSKTGLSDTNDESEFEESSDEKPKQEQEKEPEDTLVSIPWSGFALPVLDFAHMHIRTCILYFDHVLYCL